MNKTDLHVLYVSAVLALVSMFCTVALLATRHSNFGTPLLLLGLVAFLDFCYMCGRMH